MEQSLTSSPSVPPSSNPPLLPVWKTVGKSYSLAWAHRGQYVKISWFWIALTAPVRAIYIWAVWGNIKGGLCIDYGHPSDGSAFNDIINKMLVAGLPMRALDLLCIASIAVAWHRLILLNETVADPRYLRHDQTVRNYFAMGAALAALTAVPTALIMHGSLNALSSGERFLVAAGVIMALVLSIRLSIILPAQALGLKQVTLKSTWQRTRWNFWRLFCGYFLVGLVAKPLALLTLTACNFDSAGPFVYAVSNLLSLLIILPTMLTFLSLCYQHFFEREPSETSKAH